MFRRFLTLLALLAIATSSINGLSYPREFTSSATALKSTKERKKCAPCSAGLDGDVDSSPIDKLASLGRRTQVQPFMPVQRSVFEGATVNFVSTVSGQLAFAVTDLELAGAMPLMFQRIYSSDRNEDRGLGAGWSFVIDDRIRLDNDKAEMKTGSGASISFRRDAGGSHFSLQVDAPLPHQSFDLVNEETITEQSAGLTRTYVKLGDVYRLSRIADSNGNAINVNFDARGNIARIESSSGGMFTLDWSNGADARLLSVTDNTGRRVTFKQDGQRLLRAMTDPAGAQWTYDYKGTQLTKAADPLNRTMLRVRYDRTGRVVETGDAAGAYLYEYDSASSTGSRLTKVTDPLGTKTYFEQSESGALTGARDDEGQSVRFEYNEANRLVRMSNSLGDETKFTYDAQNRLLRQWSTDGTDKSYGYDERGRLNSVAEGGVRTDYTLDDSGRIRAAQSGDSGRSYRASYDARGQLTSLKSDKREVSFEYDASGNKTAFTYSDVGRFRLERDAKGRVITERFPSGLNIYNDYDGRGWLEKQSDNRGRSMRVERDQSGAPVAYVRSDGKRLSLARDETSRVVAMTDFNGSTRRFTYNSRGALTDYTDAKGRRYKYEYDHPGRLRSIIKADGTRINVERDEKGRVRRVIAAANPGNATGPLGKLSAHAPAIQVDMDDPNIDWGDPLVIDVWGRYWRVLPLSGGLLGDSTLIAPIENVDGGGGAIGAGGGGGTMTEQEKFQCALAVVLCFAAIGFYIQSIGGLGAACGETAGLGCLGALLLHPVLGSVVVLQCADAINKCHLNR